MRNSLLSLVLTASALYASPAFAGSRLVEVKKWLESIIGITIELGS